MDYRLPGAGVLVAPRKDYADRNNESLGMPPSEAPPAGTLKREFKIPAGEPVAFVYNHMVATRRSLSYPSRGDYELNASGSS